MDEDTQVVLDMDLDLLTDLVEMVILFGLVSTVTAIIKAIDRSSNGSVFVVEVLVVLDFETSDDGTDLVFLQQVSVVGSNDVGHIDPIDNVLELVQITRVEQTRHDERRTMKVI